MVRVEGDTAVIGITDHAQDSSATSCTSNCRRRANHSAAHESFGSVGLSKPFRRFSRPYSGEVAEADESLNDEPKSEQGSYGEGWMIKMKMTHRGRSGQSFDALSTKISRKPKSKRVALHSQLAR